MIPAITAACQAVIGTGLFVLVTKSRHKLSITLYKTPTGSQITNKLLNVFHEEKDFAAVRK